MPTPVRKKRTDGSDKSDVWWLRKKVPERFRAVAGRREIWRSLDTTDRKTAVERCVILSAEIEREWLDRLGHGMGSANVPIPKWSLRELSGLQRLVHERARDAYIENPPSRYRWGHDCAIRSEEQDSEELEYDEANLDAFLQRTGHEMSDRDRGRFLPMYVEARREAARDLQRAALHRDFSESAALAKYAPSPAKKIDFLNAFEFYCEKSGIKGGKNGPTAKRWRPKIREFCDFVGHTDLAKVTGDDGYRWVDHLIAQGIVRKSVREVWIASLKATASFMVERLQLAANPFTGVRVRDLKGSKGTLETNKKGFNNAQATTILSATLDEPSHLTTPETRAARRWIPWICAYSGARVNEITSLLPSDIRQDPETDIWCLYLRPEMTKGAYQRTVPIHSHLLEQGLLHYVESRRALDLPLFYDPSRARGGTEANPQWQKIAQRLGDWVVKSLKITGVKPNHGWRHRFKSVARHVHMHVEVEKFITGHGGSDDPDEIAKVSLAYGDPWVKTLKNTIEMYPRYEIAGFDRSELPRRRGRQAVSKKAAEATRSLAGV